MKINANDYWNENSQQGVRYFQQNGLQCYAWAVKFCELNSWFEGGIPFVRDDAVKNLFFDWETQKTYNRTECIRRDRCRLVVNNPSDSNQIPSNNSVILYNATAYNPYGHIEICHEANTSKMLISAQNLGSGNGEGDDDMPKQKWRGYSELEILGWIEEIKEQPPTIIQPIKEPTPIRNIETELAIYPYFYPDRRTVIKHAYENNDKDYLIFELKVAGQEINDKSNHIKELEKNMQKTTEELQKIKAVEELIPKTQIKGIKEVSTTTISEKTNEPPKTEVVNVKNYDKNIFQSKKSMMSIIAAVVTFGVTIANEIFKMNLRVDQILAIVSPLVIGVLSQAATEINV
jgi:hypothetical protein